MPASLSHHPPHPKLSYTPEGRTDWSCVAPADFLYSAGVQHCFATGHPGDPPAKEGRPPAPRRELTMTQPSRRWNDAKPMALPHSSRGFRGVPLRLHAEVPEAVREINRYYEQRGAVIQHHELTGETPAWLPARG